MCLHNLNTHSVLDQFSCDQIYHLRKCLVKKMSLVHIEKETVTYNKENVYFISLST